MRYSMTDNFRHPCNSLHMKVLKTNFNYSYMYVHILRIPAHFKKHYLVIYYMCHFTYSSGSEKGAGGIYYIIAQLLRLFFALLSWSQYLFLAL